MQELLVLSKLIPVVLLILLGFIMKTTGVISKEGMDVIKKLIIDIGLPAVLFLSFLSADIELSFLLIIAGMFSLNILLLLFGNLWKGLNSGNKYTPFLFSGFEYGMFALGIFATAYGGENISYIAVIDLGHELFIWFVFVTVLLSVSGEKKSPGQVVSGFLTSPIIAAITAGLAGNFFGLKPVMDSNIFLSGIETTVSMVGGLTAPLILLSIGAGLEFSRRNLKFGISVVLIRTAAVLLLYWMLEPIISRVMGLPFAYSAALFTLLTAPPPFIIPLFIPSGNTSERAEINSVLTLYTLSSLAIFMLFFSAHPVLG